MVWHVHDRISEDYLPQRAAGFVRGFARTTAHGVIANSRATLATLGPLRRPAAVIPEPVGHQAFGERRSRNGQPFVAAMVGRIAPWKGQDVFLRAFARGFPGGDERAVIVGAPLFGEEEFDRSLRALVGDLGLGDRVEFRGFREDVAAELAEVDALVHASVIPEPFGRVIVEGMAAGLPVLAAGAGGPDEIVTEGVDGLLYPPGDVDTLAATLRRVAADTALAERLGQAAVERASAFAPELAAAQTTAFYRRLLEAA
jgi:glycosyltransferase involved in cell wall biosynthesis